MLAIRISDYLRLAESVAGMRGLFWITDPEPDDPGRDLDDHEKADLDRLIARAKGLTDQLNMPISRKMLAIKSKDPPQNGREFKMLRDVIYAELESKSFFFIPDYLAKFYDRDDALSDRARLAFPECYSELKSSGNCIACGEWTASVFHGMRAAEIGVRIFGRKLGVSFPDKPLDMAEWHQVLDNADAKIRAISQRPKNAERDADQAFFSQAAAEFRYFKDGWRVRVAHARATYSENEALKIYDHVRDFFEVLSSRLSEEDVG